MTDTPRPAVSAREPRFLFVATLLTGSFLLFLVQPMIARMALPRLGGAPAVWNSAMLVYQALLLGGYAYAHALSRLAPRTQAMLHLALFAIAALWLPVGLSRGTPGAGDSPILWVPWLLVSSIGPLFFVVAAQAPLMQRWFALRSTADPYPLYAASNLGSFAGLISYPLLVEPALSLRGQSLLWSGLFVVLVILVAACGLLLPRGAAARHVPAAIAPVSTARYLRWIALAAVPSGLMLSTTTHLTTDVVAVPFLWVLPLGLYLLSFTVAFSVGRRGADIATLVAPLLILSVGGLAFAEASRLPLFLAFGGLTLLFVVAVALHAELYRTRPGPEQLTGFYLAMSVGGVLGGIFCALIAPTLFDWTYEHPLLIIAAAAVVPQGPIFDFVARIWEGRHRQIAAISLILLLLLLTPIASGAFATKPLWLASAATVGISLLALVSVGRRLSYVASLLALMIAMGATNILATGADRTRSYFGVYSVQTRKEGDRALLHGTTVHGIQLTKRGEERTATTYYAPWSGVGLAMSGAEVLFGQGASVGVVGLGTGTLACYRRPGQNWTFFEIDQGVVRITRDEARFTFLRRCTPDARVVIGDARLTLAAEPAGRFHLLALDAFSSDAVPLHLLTAEAFGIYARALRPDGLLMVHISNRYLELEPVIAAAAKSGWSAALRDYRPTEAELAKAGTRSIWVAMSRSPDTLRRLTAQSPAGTWRPLRARRGFNAWTDDHATVLPLMEFNR